LFSTEDGGLNQISYLAMENTLNEQFEDRPLGCTKTKRPPSGFFFWLLAALRPLAFAAFDAVARKDF
jgi:hypothetical protein